MERLKLLYQNWMWNRCEMLSEEDTLMAHIGTYQYKINKRVPSSMKNMSLKEWCLFAYNRNVQMIEYLDKHDVSGAKYNQLLDEFGFEFEIIALLESNLQPYAYLHFLGSDISVCFLDELKREFMTYRFGTYGIKKKEKKESLFLDRIELRYYPDVPSDDGEWEENKTISYCFKPDGNLKRYEYTEDKEIISEADAPVDVERNWQKLPAFEDLGCLFEMKRWGDDGILPLPELGTR